MDDVSQAQAERVLQRCRHQAQNPFSRIATVSAASRAQAQSLLQGCGGLSVVEWRILWDLHEAGPMTIRDLAQIQRADHSQISRALPVMVKKGLVTMRRDDVDARQMIVALTGAGRQAHDRAAPIMRHRRQALAALFKEGELAQLMDSLDRIETFLRTPTDILPEEPTS